MNKQSVRDFKEIKKTCSKPRRQKFVVDKMLEFVLKNGLGYVDYFIAFGFNINVNSCEGHTLLHLAVLQGDLPLVVRLLTLGADIRAKDAYERTPFIRAIIHGKHYLLGIFYKFGTDINQKTKSGKSAISLAKLCSEKCFNKLLQLGAINE